MLYTFVDKKGEYMSKEDVLSTIVYVIMIAFALVAGIVILQPKIEAGLLGREGALFVFLLLSLIIGLILNAILIEIGHLIGAKLGKYEILAFNVLGVAIFKEKIQGKIETKFKFPRPYDGLCGETIIAPKSEKSKPMSFVFLPLVMFLLEVLGCICSFLYIKDTGSNIPLMFLKYGILISTIIGGMIVIYDYFPTRLDNMNDGYRLVLLNKKINAEAFNELLKVERSVYFNEEVGEIKQFEQITDFTAKVNMLSAAKYALKDHTEAIKIIDNILVNNQKISKNTEFEIKIKKSIILFLYEDLETAKNYYLNDFSDDERKRISSCKNIEAVKLYMLYSSLIEKSESECAFAIERSEKILKKSLPGEREKEGKIIDLIKTKIKQGDVYEKKENQES